MTSKLEQAARQALVALEDVMADFDGSWALADTAITALREALAEQAEQEPVGFGVMAFGELQQSSVHYEAMLEAAKAKQDSGLWDDVEVVELYTRPVRTKDLTDDEIEKAVENIIFDENFDINIARAVIAADREKNRGS